MRKGMHLLCLCIAVIALALPALANSVPLVAQGEDIPTSGWTDVTPATSPCTTSVISDANAVGGQALEIVDPGSAGTDQFYAIYKAVENGMGTTGTAVVRIKTSSAAPFNTDRWDRNVMFGFMKKSGYAKRSIGLCIRPDSAGIANTLGTTLYPGSTVFYGDNTQFVTWTIVARQNGKVFDLYRNGVKIVNNFDGQASGGEAAIMTGDGVDSIAVGSGNNVYLPDSVPPVANSTGAWIVDGVACRDGEYPYWNPINPSGISGKVIDATTSVPVANATVSLGTNYTTTTDANGDYSFTDLNMGTYSATVTSTGDFYPRTLSIVVNEGAITHKDIELVGYPALTSVLYDNFERDDSTNMGTTEDDSHTPWVGNGTDLAISNHQLVMSPNSLGNGICPNGYGSADFDATWKTYKNEASTSDLTHWVAFHYRGWYADSFDHSMLFHCRVNGEIVLYDAYNGVQVWVGTPVPGLDYNQEHTWRVRAVGARHQAWLDGVQLYDVQYGITNGGWMGLNRSMVTAIVDNFRVGTIAAPTGTVTGRVFDKDTSAGLAGAIVSASNGTQATCDANGNYTMTLPAATELTLTARASDYYVNTVSGVQPLPSTPATADIGLSHLPALAESIVVTDDFNRPDNTDLGSTLAPNVFPWVRGSGETASSISGGQLYEDPYVACSGVSIGGGFLPADVDMTVKLTMTPNVGTWCGVGYRQGLPGTFDTQNGQALNDCGYLVWCQADGNVIHLWRAGDIATYNTHVDWSVPHILRVRAIGPYHQVWLDGNLIIDVLDSGKLIGGYASLLRDLGEARFDDLTVIRYTQDTGQISGTVLDAVNPSQPVEGARVMLSNGQIATSDANGYYEFKRLPNGTFTVSAGSDDYYYRAYPGIVISDQVNAAVQNIKLVHIPDTPAQTVFDDFNRPDSDNLGSTSVGNIPWDKSGETTTANIVGNTLSLTPMFAHGVSLDSSFQPADVDMSVQLTILGDNWGGICYRQSIPGAYDTWNGQTAANAGYLVWCTSDGTQVNLWRNGFIATARLDNNPVMWYYWPQLRVRAIGAHHQVFVDYGWGDGWQKIIDVYDSGKLTGGYCGCYRESVPAVFDDFSVSTYVGPTSTITGTISDSNDSSIKLAGAKIRFADGTVATADANGVYTATVTSWGTTSCQAIADTYRQKTVDNIDVVLLGTTTLNVSLGLLPDAVPAFDTYTRGDSINCGVTEDSIHRGYSKAWDLMSQAVQDLTQVQNQQLVLLHDDAGSGSGVSVQNMYPIDVDLSIDGKSEALVDGDWCGMHYRAWSAAAWYRTGYLVRWFNDGTVQLLYNPGNRIVKEVKLSTVPDWTQTHRFRVRCIGIKHSFWIDGQPIWTDVEDWGQLEYGYAGVSHKMATFYVDNLNDYFDAAVNDGNAKPIESAVDAKTQPNGTVISLSGPVVTAQFNGFFYVEDADRTAGIKVVSSVAVNPGDLVTVEGTVQSADGEKYISATSVSVGSQADQIKPLGMTNKANAPVAGLTNIALLTTVWGNVLSVSGDNTYCYIDDGSGVSYEAGVTGIKVLLAGATIPSVGDSVACTGIARITSGGVPVLQMRTGDDLVITTP